MIVGELATNKGPTWLLRTLNASWCAGLPKCSRRAQLEPFSNDPVFATLSRQTTYNVAPEKPPFDLSRSSPVLCPRPLAHSQSTCNQRLPEHNAPHAANHRLLLAV